MFLRSPLTIGCVSLLACGPTVPFADEGDTSGSTTMPVTSVGSSITDATVTTASTSTSTTATTTPSDEVTSIDSSSEGGSEGGEGESFIMKPDAVCFTHCTMIECDVWAQDCPEGEKCMPWANDGGNSWNASRCTPIDPRPAAIGDPCVVEGSGVSGIDDCDISAMCWGVDPDTLDGVCVGFCIGSEANAVCNDGLTCFSGFEGKINLCLPPCDPLGSSCAADETCGQYFYAASFDPTDPFACLPIPPFESQPYGAPCGLLQLCDAGHVCVEAPHVPGCADLGCCTTVGDIAAPPVCPDVTQSCIPFDDEAMEGPCFCGVP
jgi:hypothetical protein